MKEQIVSNIEDDYKKSRATYLANFNANNSSAAIDRKIHLEATFQLNELLNGET